MLCVQLNPDKNEWFSVHQDKSEMSTLTERTKSEWNWKNIETQTGFVEKRNETNDKNVVKWLQKTEQQSRYAADNTEEEKPKIISRPEGREKVRFLFIKKNSLEENCFLCFKVRVQRQSVKNHRVQFTHSVEIELTCFLFNKRQRNFFFAFSQISKLNDKELFKILRTIRSLRRKFVENFPFQGFVFSFRTFNEQQSESEDINQQSFELNKSSINADFNDSADDFQETIVGLASFVQSSILDNDSRKFSSSSKKQRKKSLYELGCCYSGRSHSGWVGTLQETCPIIYFFKAQVLPSVLWSRTSHSLVNCLNMARSAGNIRTNQ